MIQIVHLQPMRRPVLKFVDGSLDAYRDLVGGTLERTVLTGSARKPGIDLVCNDEFLMNGSEPNFSQLEYCGDTIFFGDVFFVRHDAEGEWVDLTDEDLTFIDTFMTGAVRHARGVTI